MLKILIGGINKKAYGFIFEQFSAFCDARCLAPSDCDIAFFPGEGINDILGRLPTGWQPDLLLWWSPEFSLYPKDIELSPFPTVAVVGDWNLGFNSLKVNLKRFDWIVSDKAGVEVFRQCGYDNIDYCRMFSFNPYVHKLTNQGEREYDIVFIGNINKQVQQERSSWLNRLLKLGNKYKIRVFTGIYGEEYGKILNQSKIVFNRSIRGELNMRAYESAACGALLFMEDENLEVRDVFEPGQDCVLYNSDNLEELFELYLDDEEKRKITALNGNRVIQEETYGNHFKYLLDLLETRGVLHNSPKGAPVSINYGASPVPNVIGDTSEQAHEVFVNNYNKIFHRRFAGLPESEKKYYYGLAALQEHSPETIRLSQEYFKKAIGLSPKNADFWNAYGLSFAVLPSATEDDLEKAARILNEALKISPESVIIYFNLANLYLSLKEYDKAEPLYEKLLLILETGDSGRFFSENTIFYPYSYDFFRVKWELNTATAGKNKENSYCEYKKLLKWKTLEQLGELKFIFRNLQKARFYYQNACEIYPEFSFFIELKLGRTLFLLGQYNEARDIFAEAYRKDVINAEVWAELLAVYHKLNEPEKTAALCREIENLIVMCPFLTPFSERIDLFHRKAEKQLTPGRANVAKSGPDFSRLQEAAVYYRQQSLKPDTAADADNILGLIYMVYSLSVKEPGERKKAYRQALKYFKKSLLRNPESVIYNFNYGLCLLHNQDEKAREVFLNLLKILEKVVKPFKYYYPDFLREHPFFAEIIKNFPVEKTFNMAETPEELRQELKEYIYEILSHLEKEAGNLQEAFDYIQGALKISANSRLYYKAATFYRMSGDIDKALSCYAEAIKAEPENPLYQLRNFELLNLQNRETGKEKRQLEELLSGRLNKTLKKLSRDEMDRASQLIPYTPPDIFTFFEQENFISVLKIRFEKTNNNYCYCDIFLYNNFLKRRLTLQFIKLSFSDLTIALPDYLLFITEKMQLFLKKFLKEAFNNLQARGGFESVVDVTLESLPDIPSEVWDGEGIVPGVIWNELYTHSAKRYFLAQKYAAGKNVLDFSAGSGYGSRILAEKAALVTSINIEKEANDYAKCTYPADNIINRRVGFITENSGLPFETGQFDLLTVFEVIEHIPENEMDFFFNEIKRVVKPDGEFFISTPNKIIYQHYPDPGHISLQTLQSFKKLLERYFETVCLYGQLRSKGLPLVFDEYEIISTPDDSNEVFIARCSNPRTEPLTRLEEAETPESRKYNILTFNWHPPYLTMLAKTGHNFDVVNTTSLGDGTSGWKTEQRPVPDNVNLVSSQQEIAAKLSRDYYDFAVCHTVSDLDFLENTEIPLIFVAHNSLTNETYHDSSQREQLKKRVMEALEKHHGLFTAISAQKLDDWEIPGMFILPGIDTEEYQDWIGDIPSVLTVGNLLRERGHMLGYQYQKELSEKLPYQAIGFNPGMEKARPGRDWQDLKDCYSHYRVYLNTTIEAYEDGYNLALLEAMAAGMPVVTLRNRTSPVINGENGFTGNSVEELEAKLILLLDDYELARKLGHKAREMVTESFPLSRFKAKWEKAMEICIQKALKEKQQVKAVNISIRPDFSFQKKKVLLATVSSPIATGKYYEKAFSRFCEVITCGPSLSTDELKSWKQHEKEQAFKNNESSELNKIELISRLIKPNNIVLPNGITNIEEYLDKLPEGWQPDLFLWIDNGLGFLPLNFSRPGLKSACIMIDTHTGGISQRIDYARNFDYVFLAQRQDVPKFINNGCQQTYWLPLACDQDIHAKTETEKAYDISFIGQTSAKWHQLRVRLLNKLKDNGFDVNIDSRILQEMALMFSRSRIVFNCSLNGDLNMRVFEALCSGSMLLTDRLPAESGLELLFENKKHLVLYNEDDLSELAAFYLKTDTEREKIAARGRQDAVAKHTYEHRAIQVLKTIFGF